VDLSPRCSVTFRQQCAGGLCEHAAKPIVTLVTTNFLPPLPNFSKVKFASLLRKSMEGEETTESGLLGATGCVTVHSQA
jgi:hypothetical protein